MRAKDWPQLNFIIYHGGYRFPGGGVAADAWPQFEQTGRIEWVSDLVEIPAKYGVKNVYADVGQLFAQTTVAEPRVTAALSRLLQILFPRLKGVLGNMGYGSDWDAAWARQQRICSPYYFDRYFRRHDPTDLLVEVLLGHAEARVDLIPDMHRARGPQQLPRVRTRLRDDVAEVVRWHPLQP